MLENVSFTVEKKIITSTFDAEQRVLNVTIIESSGEGATVSVVDGFSSSSTTAAGSANNDRLLKSYIDNINTILNSDDTTLDELQEIVNFIKQNKTELETLGISNIAGLQDTLTNLQNQVTDNKKDVISFAVSSPGADLTAGDTDGFHAPYDFTLNNFFVGLSEAPTGSAAVFDVKKAGVSVTTTKAIVDSGETTSLTGTAPVLNGTVIFTKGDLITPNITQVGALNTGKSAKFYFEITKS